MMERYKPFLAGLLCWMVAISPLQAPATGTSSFGARASSGRLYGRNSMVRNSLPPGPIRGDLRPNGITAHQRFALFASLALNAVSKNSASGAATAAGEASALLPDGRIFIVGGKAGNKALSSAFIKDAHTGAMTQLTGQMQHPRYGHTATTLPNGSVLIFGGVGSNGALEGAAEIFDPRAQSFVTVNTPGLQPRAFHTATLLIDGRVVIAGGLSQTGETTGTLQ